jgi:periplasmic divalent cation tolerance protein
MNEAILVLTNVPDAPTAHRLARHIVKQKLAACVNILPSVQSIYRWQDSVEEATEVTLLIKTSQARYVDLEAAIKVQHPYELPEIVALSVAGGLPAYLAWVVSQTEKNSNV